MPRQDPPETVSKIALDRSRLSHMLLPGIAVVLLLGATGILVYVKHLLLAQQEATAIADARSFATYVFHFRDFYAREIVPRAYNAGMAITHEYSHLPDALPLPATLTLDLGDYISKQHEGFSMALYSHYPFPWRLETRILDTFQEDALKALTADPSSTFVRIEQSSEGPLLRLALADRLKENCLGCHNSYSDSPKTDWVAGDVRGVLEISRSMVAAETGLAEGMRKAVLVSISLVVFTVLLLWWVLRILYRTIGESQYQEAQVRKVNKDLHTQIIQRETAESKTRINEAKLRAIFDSVLEAVIVIDQRSIIVEVNRVAADIFGYELSELPGQNVKVLMPQEFAQHHDEYISRYLRSNEAKIIGIGRQVQGLRSNGEVFPMHLAVSEVSLAGRRLFVGIVADITDSLQKQAELKQAHDTALESARTKSEFLANMSHEIRTPMNGVMGMTQLLRETELDAYQRDLVETVDRSANALLEIINDILDLSKIEAGKVTLRNGDFNPLTVLEDVVRLFRGNASVKQVRLELLAETDAPQWINGDQGRFRQIVSNLVGNAVKFTQQGSVTVRARASHVEYGLEVQIEDTGLGIPESHFAQLFDPFTQVDGSASRQFGGTGLGLAISRELVELMGGHINVSSILHRGSTFTFNVIFSPPNETPRHVAKTAHLDVKKSATPASPSAKILVAEDNQINQKLLQLLLQKRGHTQIVVENGLQAIETLSKQRFDLILMDCQMPEIDGYEATRRWRNIELTMGIRRTPIIALTANAMEGDRESCLDAGMDDYLSKPINSKLLDEKIAYWLETVR